MPINEQAARIAHHTSTTTGAFTVPSSEDFTDGSWDKFDLAKSEIGINEFDNKIYARIGSSVVELLTSVGGVGSLADTLAIGSATGVNDITVDSGQKVFFDGSVTDYITKVFGTQLLVNSANIVVLRSASNGNFSLGTTGTATTENLGTTQRVALDPTNNKITFDDGTYDNDLVLSSITAARTWTLPDETGTLALTSGKGFPIEMQVAISDESTDLVTGTTKLTFRMPHAMTLTEVRASVSTAPTGSTIIVDINQNATSVLSTKLSIDATEKTSTTAATASVISTSALTDDAEITIDIDQVGSTIKGTGLKVTLIGTRV